MSANEGMRAGQSGGEFGLLHRKTQRALEGLTFATVRAAACRVEEKRGHDRPTFGVDIQTFGGAVYPNVPYCAPYLNGKYGEHVAVEPGATCLVGFVGGEQPVVLGFIHFLTPDGTYGSHRGNRPKLAPGDHMSLAPGQRGLKGPAMRYFAKAGFIVDRAAAECQRIYDPTLDRITDFCRDHRIITSSGRIVWNEDLTRARNALYRRLVFARAKSSPLGTGPFVDTLIGTVPRLAEGGSPLTGLDVYCRNVNGKHRTAIDEDGNSEIRMAGTTTILATEGGFTAAKVTGTVSSLPTGGIKDQTFNISVNGLFTYAFSVFTNLELVSAIANEINDNCSEIVASVTSGGFLEIQTKKLGSDASLTISGTAATTLGVVATVLGTEGPPIVSQDVTLEMRGDLKIGIGAKTGTGAAARRAIEVTITEEKEYTIDAGDAVLKVDGTKGEVEVTNKAGCKVTLKSDGTVVIEGTKIELGEGATDGLVKKADLQTWARTFTVPTGVGPSGPPSLDLSDATFSTKVLQEL